jgi:pimeloyl-ACP methyl ester carboxylesterase
MKTETVSVNGMEMHYRTEGSGEPLLLLHGGGGCHEDWVHAGRDQFAQYYTLIAPDARGHGRSTNPPTVNALSTPSLCSTNSGLKNAMPSASAWAATRFST